MGGRRSLSAVPSRRTGLRLLTLLVVLTVLAGLAEGQAFAAGSQTTSATPVQHSGTAAGKPHRAPSAVRKGKGNAKAGPQVAAPQHKTGQANSPHLSNVHQTATAPTQPARMTSRAAVASGAEDVSLRTATRSVYKNADGTYTAKVYSQPIHYRTANGSWANIDTMLARQPNSTWQEKANSGSPVFAATGESAALMMTPLGAGESISFSVQGAAATSGSVSGNMITYAGILPNAAVTYAANAAGVKETLVLNNASAPTTWTFPLTLRGLTASLNGDGAVLLSDKSGKVVQTIPHGFMQDSNIDPRSQDGQQSSGVTYTLATVGGQQVLRVDLDPTWVHDPARVFPVNVDPTSLNTSGSTYVMSQFRNDYSTDTELKVGTYDGGGHVANSYLMFNVGGAFPNDYIEAATLNLNNVSSWSCQARPVYVSPILSGWSVTGLKTYPWVSYGGAIGQSSFAAGYTGCGAQWESVDLGDNPSAAGTRLIESWAHNGQNLGLAVTASSTDDYGYKKFSSINTRYAPYLSITYSDHGADYSPAGTYYVPTATVNGSQQVTVTNRGNGTWVPGQISLGYQLFNMSWQRLSVGATDTALPYNVGPNQTVTVNGTIGAMTPGQYILCWDMMVSQNTSFNLTYGVPTATCEVVNSNNTPPQIDSINPLGGAVLGTLTPTLAATGHDPDNYPGNGITFDFQVWSNPQDGSAASLLVDSGGLPVGTSTYTVPIGKLAWNQSYSWVVSDSDGVGSSYWSASDFFSIAVPQPLVTSHLGSAVSGRSFDPGVGDYTTSATDAKVSVAGPALSIVRSYNSQDPRTGNLFGSGWSTEYDMMAVPDADGSGNVVVTYPDGRTVRFGLNSDGSTFTPPQGIYATFQSVSGGGYTLTVRGGTTYTFTTPVGLTWKLTSISDADHRTETLTYTGGQLTTVTNTASHRLLHFTWSSGHPVNVATDPVTTGGQPLTWTYGYSGTALTKVCPPATPTKCTAYGYTGGSGSGSHYRSLVLDAQPQAYWRLGDASGSTTAADEVTANMGTLNGTYSVSGVGHEPGPLAGSPEQSAYFGGNAGVTLPNQLVASSSYLTVQLWFQTPTNGPSGVLFSTGNSGLGASSPSAGAMPVLYVGTDGKLYGQFWTGSVAPIVSANPVNNGAWHEVTLVGEGASQSMYLDGALVGSQSGQILNLDPMDFAGGGYVNARTWVNGPAGGWSYFTGNIGEVAFYAHPLGAPAITQQYTAATQPAVELTSVTTPNGANAASVTYSNITDRATNYTDIDGGAWKLGQPTAAGSSAQYRGSVLAQHPNGYWPFGENSGAQAANVVADNQLGEVSPDQGSPDGTYSNVTLGEPGPFPGTADTAAGFNGTSSSVSMPDDWVNLGPQGLSVGLWFTTTATGVPLYSVDQFEQGQQVLYVGTDGKLWGGFGEYVSSSATVNDGKWHFAMLTNAVSPSGDTEVKLYLDGQNVSTCDDGCAYQGDNIIGVQVGYTANWTGPATPSNQTAGYFAGSIAQVVTYTTVLDANTVQSLFTAAHESSASATPVISSTVTDPGNATLTYRYDPTDGGRLLSATDGLGNTTTYAYDQNGFLTDTIRPDGDYVAATQDTRGNTLTQTVGAPQFGAADIGYYTYPPAGTYGATDPRDDLPLTYQNPDSAGPTDTTYQVNYTYSAGRDLLTTTQPDGAVTTNAYTAGTETATNGGTEPPGLLATNSDPLGHVTTYSYDSFGDLTKEVTPSGLTTTYTYDNLGRRTGRTQVSDSIPAGATTTYTWDAADRLLTETDPATTDAVTGTVHTPVTTHTYDPDGDTLTTTVSDATGRDASRTTTNTYTSDDHLATVTDPAGRKTAYGYDVYGNRIAMTDPAGNSYSYTYDANGHRLTTTLHGWTGNTSTPASPTDLVTDSRAYDPDGLLASDTDAMGITDFYYYDEAHRLDLIFDAYPSPNDLTQGDLALFNRSYDAAGRLIDAGNDNILNTSYTYDPSGRLTSKTVDPTTQFWTGVNQVTNYTYGNLGSRPTSQTRVNGTTSEQTDFGYDAIGDLTSQVVHDGSTKLTTTWTYDQRGLRTSMTDPRGNVSGAAAVNYTTTYTYDAASQLTTTTDPAVNIESNGSAAVSAHPINLTGYNTFGDQTSASDPDGNITSYTYDADSELLGISDPAYTPPGSSTSITPTTKYTYTSLGQTATTTDPNGNTTTNTYDQLGDLVQQAQPTVGGSTPTWTYTYDNDGQPLSATDPTGAQTQATYDILGQTLTTTQIVRQPTQVADTTTYTYEPYQNAFGAPLTVAQPGGETTTFTYNDLGDVTSVKDPIGDTTSYTYDQDLNLTKKTLPDGTATTASFDPAGWQTGQAQLDASGVTLRSMGAGYDANGNQTSATDANGVTTTVAYDAANRPVSQVQPVSSTANITTGTGYDAAGNVTRYTDGNGNKTTYTYNSLGLPEARVDPSVTGYTTAANSTTTIAYDANGEQTGITEPGGVSQTLTYDALGRMTSEAGAGAAASTMTRSLGYDAVGRLTSVNTPTGTDSYTYNDRGDLLTASGPSGTASYAYDGNNELTSRTDAAGTATYGYDNAGRLTSAVDPMTGTTVGYTYDTDSQLTGISYGTGAASQTNTYNTEHELTSQTLASSGGTTEAGINYAYSPDGQITTQTTTGTVGAATNTYTYDQADRLASWNNGTTTTNYGYDADGNRTSNGATTAIFNARDQLTSAGSTSYTYTARGTLSSKTTGSTTTNYSYNAFDQLIAAGPTTLSYDGLGRGATDGSATFTYDGLNTQPTSDGTQTFGYSPTGQLQSVKSGGTASLAFSDQHADVTALFSPTGSSLTGSAAFNPWGQVTATTGTQANLGYQGGWTDPTTGYVATASRWYSPTTADFTSRDTNPVDPTGTTAAANQYAYGNDDPMSQFDLTGSRGCGTGYGGGGGYGYGGGSGYGSGGGSGWTNGTGYVSGSGGSGGGGGVLGWSWWQWVQYLLGLGGVGGVMGTAGGGGPSGAPPVGGFGGGGYSGGGVDGGEGGEGGLEGDPVLYAGEGTDLHPYSLGASGIVTAHSGCGGTTVVHRRPTPPPPPLGDTAPINARPVGQSDPAGDIITPQPGTKGPDSGPGDAPVITNLTGLDNPAVAPQPIFQAAKVPDSPGTSGPGPLPPAQGQLDAAQCTGGYVRINGDGVTRTAVTCETGGGSSGDAVGVASESAGSIRNVNPGGGTMNCVNCVVATDAMLDGAKVSAALDGPKPIAALENHFGAKFVAVSGKAAIERIMGAAGHGARGVVFASPGLGRIGHVFNVVNQGGTVRFLDGQAGQEASFDGYVLFSLMRYQ